MNTSKTGEIYVMQKLNTTPNTEIGKSEPLVDTQTRCKDKIARQSPNPANANYQAQIKNESLKLDLISKKEVYNRLNSKLIDARNQVLRISMAESELLLAIKRIEKEMIEACSECERLEKVIAAYESNQSLVDITA